MAKKWEEEDYEKGDLVKSAETNKASADSAYDKRQEAGFTTSTEYDTAKDKAGKVTDLYDQHQANGFWQTFDENGNLTNKGIYDRRSLDEIIQKILNREAFSYDLNGDALYQQYKDKYIQQGKMAMQDTMGQAAAMTGGYGNSYASTAGNQAYQAHLQNLNDIVPELYQMAYDRYNQEGQDMYNQYSLLANDMEQQYNMWMDEGNRLMSDRDYYQGVADNLYARDYGEYMDELNMLDADRRYANDVLNNERNWDFGVWSDNRNFDYGVHRDDVADSQWAAELAESQRQHNESLAEQRRQFDAEQARLAADDNKKTGKGEIEPRETDLTTSFVNSHFDKDRYLAAGHSEEEWKEYIKAEIEAKEDDFEDDELAFLILHYGL